VVTGRPNPIKLLAFLDVSRLGRTQDSPGALAAGNDDFYQMKTPKQVKKVLLHPSGSLILEFGATDFALLLLACLNPVSRKLLVAH
jgi:hypothetical protein